MKGEKCINFILTLAKLKKSYTSFHNNLLRKPEKVWIVVQMVRWIANLPNSETVRAVSNISKTRWRLVTNKVPQDLILGLLLFNIVINSLDARIECTHSKFSGNKKEWLCHHSKGCHQAEGMRQKELHDVQQTEIPSPTHGEE